MHIFETVLPILLITLSGYFVAHRKLLTQGESSALSKFVFTYAIPSLLFIGTATANLPPAIPWEFFLSYYLAVAFVYGLGILIAKYVYGYAASEQSAFGMGAAYSNTSIVGVPVCLQALGKESLLPLFMLISVHCLLLFAFGTLIAERHVDSEHSIMRRFYQVSRNLIFSPITGSLLAGVIVNIYGINIYKPAKEAITLMGNAAVPTALFVLGVSLRNYKIAGQLKPALVIAVLKTMLLPLVVWLLAFKLFELNKLWASTALLAAAMPVGINAYVFSKKYQACEAPVAAAIAVSTTGCIFTISGILSYLST